MAEYDDIMKILMNNSNKSFVKRILNPEQYPTLDLGNGQIATHKMAWGETEIDNKNRYIVFPTVLYTGKKLVDYGDKAFNEVMKTGNYIEFDDPQTADWFSRRYKIIWGDK